MVQGAEIGSQSFGRGAGFVSVMMLRAGGGAASENRNYRNRAPESTHSRLQENLLHVLPGRRTLTTIYTAAPADCFVLQAVAFAGFRFDLYAPGTRRKAIASRFQLLMVLMARVRLASSSGVKCLAT